MKIAELVIAPKESKDTTSCGTTSSAIKGGQTQDIVSQNIVPEMVNGEIESHPDHSAIAEGGSQIFRRRKGGAPQNGISCSSGPRKGRIVAKPSTCFQKLDPVKGSKIKRKRKQKAAIAGKKLAQTKRSGAGSLRLKGAQIKRTSQKGPSFKGKLKGKAPVKSKIVRPK